MLSKLLIINNFFYIYESETYNPPCMIRGVP